jgi:hypothetical protein
VEVPAAAVEPATKVRALLPAPGAAILPGAKVAVTPVGTPLMENATAELNAFTFAVVKVMGADPPGATVALVALDDSVKLAVDCTVRLNGRVLVVPPPTAPIVREETPAVAAELTASVKVLFPLPGAAMLVGLRLAVTPLGSPLMER